MPNTTGQKLNGEAPVVGRFAPSPTGRMHAGNIYASLLTWLIVKAHKGKVVLRIEDLDKERSRASFVEQVQRDYILLGLTWDKGPYFQQGREEAYQQAFDRLQQTCKVYPCFCSRADLQMLSAAPHFGEKRIYPGTCRYLTHEQQREKAQSKNPSFRIEVPNETFGFRDLIQGDFSQNLAHECGDFLLRRADNLFAYQLAVCVDDAAQGINLVVRGYDLITSTPQQMFLLKQLGCAAPEYAHVPLLVNKGGKRLSKRDKDASLQEMLAQYRSPHALLGHIAYVGKIIDVDEPATPTELLAAFDFGRFVARIQRAVGVCTPLIWE